MPVPAALLGLLLGLAPASGPISQETTPEGAGASIPDGSSPGPAGPTAPGAPAAGLAPPDVEVVRDAARRLHEERRHAEAAALLERLAAEAGRPDLLFDAGQARFAAGHRAHALRLWQAYADSPGRDAEDIALAARRIADARALTTPITLIVHASSDMSHVTVTARRLHDPPDAARPPITLRDLRVEGAAHTAALGLDPGVWEIVAAAEDGPPGRREVIVGRAPQTVELALASPAPPVPRDDAPPATTRPRLGAVQASLGAASLVAGTVAAIVGARDFGRRLAACDAARTDPPCSEAVILADARLTSAGAGLVGAGVGLLATAVIAFAPRTASARRRAWTIEAIAGGAALVAGAAWLAAGNLAYAPGNNDAYIEWIGPWHGRRAVAASLLGAGSGLALGAAAGLWLPSRPRARTAWRPALGLPGVGLTAAF